MSREEVIGNLRACLLSAKGGLKIEDLNPDYKTIVGENIPFARLGWPSLQAFLRTIPNIKVINKGGAHYVEAIPTEDTVHITHLISKQKSASKGSKKSKGRLGNRNPIPFRRPYHGRNIPRNTWPTRNTVDYSNNTYRSQDMAKPHVDYSTGRYNDIPPLMQQPIKSPVRSDKPRYVQRNVTPTSPSKRLKEKQQANFISSSSQSINQSKNTAPLKSNDISERLATPVISQKPKTVQNSVDPGKRSYPLNISDRININSNIFTSTPNSTMTNTSESQILSPLSPGQLITGNNNIQHTEPLVSPLASLNVRKRVVPKSVNKGDPRHELLSYIEAVNLPQPVYNIQLLNTKNPKERAVYARVKIGTYSYSSYPNEAQSQEDAQKIAATIALKNLLEKGALPNIVETTDKNLIKERVLAIIDKFGSGTFTHTMPTYYKDAYNESLPENWLKIIAEYPAIVCEKCSNNLTILRRFVSHGGKTPDVLPHIDKISLSPIGLIVPEQLELPKDEYWMVTVTYVTSTNDIGVRLIGDDYSDKLDALTAEMAEYYEKHTELKTPPIEVGQYYVVFESDSWHRVRCIEHDSSCDTATVLFIDYGDEDDYPCNKLRTLDKMFCILPAQAIRVSMAGLEDFEECCTILSHIEKCLFGHAFYVEVVNFNIDKDGSSATVTFYDTSGPDDINLNEAVSNEILQIFKELPKLDAQVKEVFISHIEENGDIYVQFQTEQMKCLVKLLNRLIHTGLNTKDSIVTTVDMTKIYFTFVDGNWHRARVVEICPREQLKVFLIDSGKHVIVGKTNLLVLEKLSPILTNYPPQAIKLHLHNIEKSMFNDKMVARLNELAPRDEPLLVKVVLSPENAPPNVELFKRIKPNNLLVSINTTLAYENEFTRLNGDGNNNIKPRKRIDRTISKSGQEENVALKSIKSPTISDIGEFFDVHVTMAAHPGNFTIRPYSDKEALEVMMIKLQEACAKYEGDHPSRQSLREGQLFAGKHTDDCWYRVSVLSCISEDTITVYFCDFGDVSIVTLNKLQPLQSQFLVLPYQAIRARLVGIQPIGIDWSVEDCIRFQELVVERDFVSVVVETTPDKFSSAETVLGLQLIDVQTADDVYIDQLLVQEGRAVYTGS